MDVLTVQLKYVILIRLGDEGEKLILLNKGQVNHGSHVKIEEAIAFGTHPETEAFLLEFMTIFRACFESSYSKQALLS